MKRNSDSNRIRITAGMMAFMLLFIMLFSSFFIAAHADHDCTGEDCPVCAFIQQCENNIRGAGGGITYISVVILPVFLSFLLISADILSFQWGTPVSTKVRLNN